MFWILFNIFYVVGDNLHCSPLERAYKGKILGHYPENVPWNPFDSSAVCLVNIVRFLIEQLYDFFFVFSFVYRMD